MRIIVGRAWGRYSGRIQAELSSGDVVLLLREDGSALLFDRGVGVQPRNWMPSGSLIEENLRGRKHRKGEIAITHHQRGERLEIYWHSIEFDQVFPSEMTTELSKLGAESEFADLLAEKLSLLRPEYKVLDREYKTLAGPIDLLAFREDRPVVFEIKRKRISISTSYQALRYVHALQAETRWKKAEVVLVAPTLARGAREFIEAQKGVTFWRLSYEDLLAL